MTLLRLIPSSSSFSSAGQWAVWDLTSIASLCRNLIEDYYVLCYLINAPANEGEREFIQALWKYHEQHNREKMLSTGVSNSIHLPNVSDELNTRLQTLKITTKFQSLPEKHRNNLIKGKSFKLESAIELSKKAGISECYYRTEYKYCSNFSHCSPFAIFQLDQFKAGSEKALELLEPLIFSASAFSAISIRDFIKIMPDQNHELSDALHDKIKLYEEVLKWKNPAFFKEST